ncbi:uncharacterized protein LOC123684550 [Harmonia axyridis]|uniref:uncharacterized protein LOC123684550 n=1 Tax=Harmonia axyridis TaxID=115357 RepID=UPI001E2763FA|nr:uncharacterized protein LOC123684550 [Harmonia axyridis]
MIAAVSLFLSLNHIAAVGYDIAELKKQLWPHDEVGPEVSEIIREKNKRLQNTRVIMTVFSLLAVGMSIPLSGDDSEFTVIFFIKNYDEMPKMITLLFSSTMFFAKLYSMYAINNMNFLTLFTIDDIASQMLLLRKKLNSIRKLNDEKEENYYDESYQNYIDEILRSCISQHKVIFKYAKMAKTRLDTALLVVTSTGILCLAFVYLQAKIGHGIRFLINCFMTQVVTVIITYTFCNSGQLLIDECEKLHRDLCECPWILWNRSNKVNYQIFLFHSKEAVSISSLSVTLNNNLLVIMLQRALSFIAFIEQVAASH